MKDRILELLKGHPVLGTLSETARGTLADAAELLTPAAGHYLLIAGKSADAFFLIESGAVVVEQGTGDGETVNVEALRAGDIVGWSWIVEPFVWQFDALVVEPGRIWRFDAVALRALAEADPRFGYDLLLRLTHTIIMRLQHVRVRLVEEASR